MAALIAVCPKSVTRAREWAAGQYVSERADGDGLVALASHADLASFRDRCQPYNSKDTAFQLFNSGLAPVRSCTWATA